MRKKAAFICSFTGVAGALGALVRWIQLSQIVEESGLTLRGNMWSSVLVVLLLAAAACIGALVLPLRRFEAGPGYREALTSQDLLYPIASILLALVMAAGAVMLFFGASEYDYAFFQRLVALLALLTAVCLPPLAFGPKKSGGGGYICFCSLVPVLFFCLWLLVSYKEHASDPSTWVFAVEILAICSAVLAYFFAAGYAFGRPRPIITLYTSLVCALLCIVTLADTRATAKQILFLVTAVVSLLRGAVLIRNLREKSR